MSGSTPHPTRVLFVTAEAAPHFQVGGLGAVSRELPKAMRTTGVDIRVLTPLWNEVREQGLRLTTIAKDVAHEFARRPAPFSLLTPDDGETVFIDAPEFFETQHKPYADVPDTDDPAFDRWLFFSSAVVAAARALKFIPDILHLNDWHTAAAAALLRCNEHFAEDVAEIAVVLTLHNAGFEGFLAPDDWRRAGFREDALQQGKTMVGPDLSLLLTGTHFADRVTTVSSTYAAEIQTDDLGPSFADKLRARGADLTGILNGIDDSEYNPATDSTIKATFNSDDLRGKAITRNELCRELDLDMGPVPLFGMVGRLTDQKGIDLLLQVLPGILAGGSLRLAILGQGEPEFEAQLLALAKAHPSQLSVTIGFESVMARRITAASDFFLMPSRFEPCGLNQLIAQRYGAIPVVHSTGGLADSILSHSPETRDASTGISFKHMTPTSLSFAIQRAVSMYRRDGHLNLRQRIMRLDLGWQGAVDEYLQVYSAALSDRRDRKDEAARLDGIRLEPDAPYIEPLRAIPTHFSNDFIRLMVRDAGTLYAYWEVSGVRGSKILDSLDEDTRFNSVWWIELTNQVTEESRHIDIEAFGKNWFIEVPPATTWIAELWMHADGSEPVSMARSVPATTPRAWEGSSS